MRQINSAGDFEAMLRAERAIVFLWFPWAKHARGYLADFEKWHHDISTRPPKVTFEVYLLPPDGHPYTWKWATAAIDTFQEPEQHGGFIFWVQKGALVGGWSGVVGASARNQLSYLTDYCFVQAKTHRPGDIVLDKPPPFDIELLKILCCPETHQTLAFADVAMLDKVNQRLVSGQLRNRAGQPLRERIEDGLVRADGRYLYPMRRNIPVLLVDEAIPL